MVDLSTGRSRANRPPGRGCAGRQAKLTLCVRVQEHSFSEAWARNDCCIASKCDVLVVVQLGQSLTYGCRTWTVLCQWRSNLSNRVGVWVSNLTNIGSVDLQLEQPWTYECRTWTFVDLWVSNLSNLGGCRARTILDLYMFNLGNHGFVCRAWVQTPMTNQAPMSRSIVCRK